MIFVVNIFSSFVSNVFSDVIKRILGAFDDETEELKEEEEAMTMRKDDRSKGIIIIVLRLIRVLIKSRLLSPRSLFCRRVVHPLWLLWRADIFSLETR
jgi:hypothetical protein